MNSNNIQEIIITTLYYKYLIKIKKTASYY